MAARRFEAKSETIYRDLQASMRKLGATSLRVVQEPRNLLDPKDRSHLAARIVFDRNGVRYTVACEKWGAFLDNLRAAERTIFYLFRAAVEYGTVTDEHALNEDLVNRFFGIFAATPDDTVLMLGAGQRAWWEVLGVAATASKTDIQSAFRALARVHHPDTGGDPDTFKRLRRAYEDALAATGGTA